MSKNISETALVVQTAGVKETDWRSISAKVGSDLARDATKRDRERQRPLSEISLLKRSGLLNLLIPERFGGGGSSFREAVQAVIEVSSGDASIGTLLAFHYYTSSVPRFFDFIGEGEDILRKSARNNWFWGNITQPLEPKFHVKTLPDGRFVLNGHKRWSTGAALGDVTTVVGRREDARELFYAVIPTDRSGLSFDFDWDFIGLNLAETVQSHFDNVVVEFDEVIRSTHGPQLSFPPFYVQSANILYGAVIIGSIWGALQHARNYTLTRSKPLRKESATQDPYVLVGYGQDVIRLRAAQSLLEQAARTLDQLWGNRREANVSDYSSLSAIAGSARAFAAEVGLDITSHIHELTGASSASSEVGLDRYWRDIRALTLHDPLVYSVRDIGDNFLNKTQLIFPNFV